MEKINVVNLTKIFGTNPKKALKLLTQGVSKDKIFNTTGQIVGLADINFTISQGEILVVMGLSGSGKSTLIRCINRLIVPSQGQVLIDGTDISTLDHHALLELRRQKFGMVFQHFALFPHRNILDNVAFGLEIQRMEKEQRYEKARSALQLVDLEDWEDARPSQLSGGMQQRVGLARALAVEPDILLMDEAFSALDPLIRGDMQNELLTLQARVHKTILFITHDLDEALKIGNRVILMKDGQIVQIGTPEEIVLSPANEYVQNFIENVDKSKILTAKSAMIPVYITASPDDSPQTVLNKMEESCLSRILVVNSNNILLGIINIKTLQAIRDEKNIENLIEPTVPTVTINEPLKVLISILAEWSGQLPVVDEQQQLLGIVNSNTVLAALK
ncbi:glycine betaine/L-proline ABC transporter ATP-binding protein [Candidatus Halobeggiatoa sp. HSG11]|nr:glycine betaine/L-proline ABC transporter ATP-binding protein [Candidatus Halobeggiatoa sp. HSG11]